jgi:SAM-dependent methyltransferase
MILQSSRLRQHYGSAADHFDDVRLSFWDRYGRLTVERLQLPAGVSVLDVGCGTGASALPAARSVGPTGKVIGVDLAESAGAGAHQSKRAVLASESRLAVTTWGPRMFEPGSTIWWTSVGRVRPDLVPTVNPWERITTPEAIANLMRDAKIENPEIISIRGE